MLIISVWIIEANILVYFYTKSGRNKDDIILVELAAPIITIMMAFKAVFGGIGHYLAEKYPKKKEDEKEEQRDDRN